MQAIQTNKTGYQKVPRTSTTCNIVYQLKILGPDSLLGRRCSIFRYNYVSSCVFAKYVSYTQPWHFPRPGVECSVIRNYKIQSVVLQLRAEVLHGLCWYINPLKMTLFHIPVWLTFLFNCNRGDVIESTNSAKAVRISRDKE